ncbi:uncharacterized protein SCHCODRAFT_02729164 [Schizophyllum commune H4-8]|uniref:uncharacterized protein n=1 Tax=Schizophyllum commune (strain H4-8 / FGSC 9210) TaxID=578458 RepID=UPI00216070E9|nr:uncharacterized protein SCHCODRAFT_02729164 [Schizophyllum commune H4-8]KAI5893043.1 hypothetical protein SCHCODRAFT_02729164 [Schizophyllum commune H4-8]
MPTPCLQNAGTRFLLSYSIVNKSRRGSSAPAPLLVAPSQRTTRTSPPTYSSCSPRPQTRVMRAAGSAPASAAAHEPGQASPSRLSGKDRSANGRRRLGCFFGDANVLLRIPFSPCSDLEAPRNVSKLGTRPQHRFPRPASPQSLPRGAREEWAQSAAPPPPRCWSDGRRSSWLEAVSLPSSDTHSRYEPAAGRWRAASRLRRAPGGKQGEGARQSSGRIPK